MYRLAGALCTRYPSARYLLLRPRSLRRVSLWPPSLSPSPSRPPSSSCTFSSISPAFLGPLSFTRALSITPSYPLPASTAKFPPLLGRHGCATGKGAVSCKNVDDLRSLAAHHLFPSTSFASFGLPLDSYFPPPLIASQPPSLSDSPFASTSSTSVAAPGCGITRPAAVLFYLTYSNILLPSRSQCTLLPFSRPFWQSVPASFLVSTCL